MRVIICGDALTELRKLPDESVNMCVTSPPYWGLRDYGVPGQLGLEKTPEEYVAKMVEIFREVKRVLRNDGVCFINLGDSYWGSGQGYGDTKTTNKNHGGSRERLKPEWMSNFSDSLKRRFEGGVFFFGSPDPRGCSTERINILIYDKRSPDLIFNPFFTAKRISIKNGEDDFCEIGNFFHSPIECFVSRSLCLALPNETTKNVLDISNNISIIITAGNLDTDAAIRRSAMFSIKNCKASLPVEITREPIAEGIPAIIPAFETIFFNTGTKTIPKTKTINESVPLLDGSNIGSRFLGHFTIRKASEQEAFFILHNGAEVRCLAVGHLHFLSNNILTPYCSILDKEIKRNNYYRAKQEIGIPFLVRNALMEDGWICRQTIIWAKPNPMPESVTDRCTKAHEYLFMFAKNGKTILWRAKDTREWSHKPNLKEILGYDEKGKPIKRWTGFAYYYDAEAVKEPGSLRFDERPFGQAGGNRHGDEGRNYKQKVPAGWGTGPGGHSSVTHNVGTMEERKRRTDKQRGHGRRHDGFNDRWDAMEKADQCSMMVNLRSVWPIATKPFPEAHFATFPPEIPERCIKAGCPAKICAKCGEPLVRVIERPEMPTVEMSQLDRYGTGNAGVHRKVGQKYQDWRSTNPDKTVGFRPTCTCDAGTVGGTVLDPFFGAGTTGLVALRLGREFIGIDLSPDYCEMAKKRIYGELQITPLAPPLSQF